MYTVVILLILPVVTVYAVSCDENCFWHLSALSVLHFFRPGWLMLSLWRV